MGLALSDEGLSVAVVAAVPECGSAAADAAGLGTAVADVDCWAQRWALGLGALLLQQWGGGGLGFLLVTAPQLWYYKVISKTR